MAQTGFIVGTWLLLSEWVNHGVDWRLWPLFELETMVIKEVETRVEHEMWRRRINRVGDWL